MAAVSLIQQRPAATSTIPDMLDMTDVAPDVVPDKIRAYYSLAFPNFTYYLQTLSVTIGRRSARTAPATSSDTGQVDIDLGPLKNVSRLHAKIEYEEENERFVLVVLGRNGAWVDGHWSGSGSRVPLGARSQIQIATRIFDFVLPPPPVPEDTPSPSEPPLSPRQASPSIDLIDVTSLSPDSSLPTPPQPVKELPPTKPLEKLATNKPIPNKNAKKRKKPEADVPLPKPDIMPPRPNYTYAHLCYRAITAIDGKATLQEICRWVADNFEWFKYNKGTGWENSIRHSLSSHKAFEKLERCAGERGKGFFWRVAKGYEHIFLEQEASGGANSKGKGKSVLEPPLRRSVKGEANAPLPPPLTNAPLPASKTVPATTIGTGKSPIAPGQRLLASTTASKPLTPNASGQGTVPLADHAAPAGMTRPLTEGQPPPAAGSLGNLQSFLAVLNDLPDVKIPIVIDTIPSDTASSTANVTGVDNSGLPGKRYMALRDNKLVLDPVAFGYITPEHVKGLEELGARQAIPILHTHLARFIKELKKGKTKTKTKTKKEKKGDSATSGLTNGVAKANTVQTNGLTARPKTKTDSPHGSLFTTAPLQPRSSLLSQQASPQTGEDSTPGQTQPATTQTIHDGLQAMQLPPSTASTTPAPFAKALSPPPMGALTGPESPIDIIDIVDVEMDELDGPAMKKRRIAEVSV